jgi:hypothetical protein
MYAMGYSLLLQGWTIMSFFEKFCRMVGLEPTINVSKIYHQLVTSTDGGNYCRCDVRGADELFMLLEEVLLLGRKKFKV